MQAEPTRSRGGRAFLCALVLLVAAFVAAFRTTRDLAWPQDHDLYRDMASAQSFLDEGFGQDPVYRGETVWYNPLTPLVVAAAQRLTGLPLPLVYARAGTFLNLLAPIAFFAAAALLFDAWIAALALAGFLFAVGGAFPSWGAATYSPWLYPVNFAQAFFYLLILRLALLRDRPLTFGWAAATGALWGVAFLAHTAPMLIFGFVLLFAVVVPRLRSGGWGGAAVRSLAVPLLLFGLVAAGVVAIYAASIVGTYHLHIVNPIPNGFVADFLGYRKIPLMLLRHLAPPVLVAWYGLYLLLRGRCDPHARRILLPWLGLTAAAVLYGYAVTGALKVGIHLPMVVPAFHFLFYFKAAMCLLFALGAVDLGRRLAAWLARRAPLSAERWAPRLGLALALALALGNVPAYLGRYDYVEARSEALWRADQRERIAVYEWVRAHARHDDVFLASDDMGLFGVAPAGAKVVAVDPYLSSPYVDVEARRADRDAMFARLAAGDEAGFRRLARRWQVGYVVDESDGRGVASSLAGSALEPVLAAGHVRLYRVAVPKS